jgi:hypothetical protein
MEGEHSDECLSSLVEKTLGLGGRLVIHHVCGATQGRWVATLMPRADHPACTDGWAATYTSFTWNGLVIEIPDWFFDGRLEQASPRYAKLMQWANEEW